MAIYCFKKFICAFVEGLHSTPINYIPATTHLLGRSLCCLWCGSSTDFLATLSLANLGLGLCPTFLCAPLWSLPSSRAPRSQAQGSKLSLINSLSPFLFYVPWLPSCICEPHPPTYPLRDLALCSPSPSLPSWHISPGPVFLPAVIFVLIPSSSSHLSNPPPPRLFLQVSQPLSCLLASVSGDVPKSCESLWIMSPSIWPSASLSSFSFRPPPQSQAELQLGGQLTAKKEGGGV